MVITIKPDKVFLPNTWRVEKDQDWVANIDIYQCRGKDRYAAWLSPNFAPGEACPGEYFDTFNEAASWCEQKILESELDENELD